MAKAYYNEYEPYAAAWLRNLIAEGLIAPGDVDERDIRDVTPGDLRGYSQAHFFAGIGGWSAALRLAGWPDDRPVWTGSAPCQPFSAAGRQLGLADERHLWPAFHHLIAQCCPPVVFGEQVEAAIRHGWLDLVQDDLEGIGYACGAVGVPAAGVGAPHIRQRIWFFAERLAHCDSERLDQAPCGGLRSDAEHDAQPHCDPGWVGDCNYAGLEGQPGDVDGARGRADEVGSAAAPGAAGRLADCGGERRQQDARGTPCHEETDGRAGRHGGEQNGDHQPAGYGEVHLPGPTNSFWRAADWLLCRDGKWRPVEPGTFPLANGVSARVGKLRAYGNAIVPQVAAEIIAAYMEEMTMKK